MTPPLTARGACWTCSDCGERTNSTALHPFCWRCDRPQRSELPPIPRCPYCLVEYDPRQDVPTTECPACNLPLGAGA